jgi:hypothetical protein
VGISVPYKHLYGTNTLLLASGGWYVKLDITNAWKNISNINGCTWPVPKTYVYGALSWLLACGGWYVKLDKNMLGKTYPISWQVPKTYVYGAFSP